MFILSSVLGVIVQYAYLPIVPFKTAPPWSLQYGGTSVPPPRKPILNGDLLRIFMVATPYTYAILLPLILTRLLGSSTISEPSAIQVEQ